jgi:hypothetical protein
LQKQGTQNLAGDYLQVVFNEDKSAASFCLPGGSIGPSNVLQIFKVKNHKISIDSETDKASKIISTDLDSLEF